MKGDIPKQFLLLNGKPVMLFSMEAFYAYDPAIRIILVIHPDYIEYWENLCSKHKIDIPFQVIKGGETRFESVKNGLNLIEEDGFVAIHDAARPLINVAFITRLFEEAIKFGSAIPGIALTDTIRIVEGDTSRQLDRTFLRAIQTPQIFKLQELKRAYEQPFQTIFTDDASVLQSAGFSLHISEGHPGNIKITNPDDISLAEFLLKKQLSSL